MVGNIIYSRHSRRRMRLYGITEDDVEAVWVHGSRSDLPDGKTEFIWNIPNRSQYPIKVVGMETEKGFLVVTAYPLKERKEWWVMKISYDGQVDAVYIELLSLKPDGVIEVADGINIDITAEGKVVGIEFLNAKKRVNLDSLLSYEIEADSLKEIANR
jgi:uncharacterized protein YuzE